MSEKEIYIHIQRFFLMQPTRRHLFQYSPTLFFIEYFRNRNVGFTWDVITKRRETQNVEILIDSL